MEDLPNKSKLKLGNRPESTSSSSSKRIVPKNANKNIKVSEGMIKNIKKMGMKSALEVAAMNKTAPQEGGIAAFQEGVRRLYGDTRFQNAVYTPKASPGPAGFGNVYGSPSQNSRKRDQRGN